MGLLIGICVVVGTIIWVGFDHDSVRRRYGWTYIQRGAVGWVVGGLLLWIIGFPMYLWRRHQQIRDPMWPDPHQAADFASDDGTAWHRDATGQWSAYDPMLGWRPTAFNSVPEALVLVVGGTGQGTLMAGRQTSAGPGNREDPTSVLAHILANDQAATLLALGLEDDPPMADVVRTILANAPPDEKGRFMATVVRADALEVELSKLVESEAHLVPGYEGQPPKAVQLLAQMLGYLVNNQVGAFARLGAEQHLSWTLLPDRLEQMKQLSPAERRQMAGCCAYVRQRSMIPTGMQELLATNP